MFILIIYWSNTGTSEIWSAPYTPGTAAALITGADGTNLPALLKKPLGRGVPVISGNQVGQTLFCSQGLWQADVPGAFLAIAPAAGAFAYSWTLNGNIIPGANLPTLVPTVSGFYTCAVTASNFAGSTTQVGNTVVQPAPIITKAFIPDHVDNCGCSKLVITLTNPSTVPTYLSQSLVDKLPRGLKFEGGKHTSCFGGFVFVRGSTLILDKATIFPQSSCTVSVDVSAECNGTFTNTIPAGALQTNNGSNSTPAFASVTFCCENAAEISEMCLDQNMVDIEEENI